jgi:CheY-like chemotaxis protein
VVSASREGVDGDWHAVILEVMLPGMDGLEVLKRIRTAKLTAMSAVYKKDFALYDWRGNAAAPATAPRAVAGISQERAAQR